MEDDCNFHGNCFNCNVKEGVQVFETHAGGFHTACSHAACQKCLKAHVVQKLPESRGQWQLAVPCPVPGCQKRIPQRLVLQVEEAQALAKAIDSDNVWPCLNDEPVCPRCGAKGAVFVNRECGHAACEACWLTNLDEKLRWCRENFALDIPCVHEGCGEGCRTVFKHFEHSGLSEVGLFYEHIDQQMAKLSPYFVHGPPGAAGPLCTACSSQALAVMYCPCGAQACGECWESVARSKLAWCKKNFAFRPERWQCWHPKCSFRGNLLAFLPSTIVEEFVAHSAHLDAEIRRVMPLDMRPSGPDGAGPTCPICTEVVPVLLHPASHNEHSACEECWKTWGEEQMELCYLNRSLPPRCLGPNCAVPLHEDCHNSLWALIRGSEKLTQLRAGLKRRQRLQQSLLYPREVQVNCPQPGCLGLGYLGFETVMCFVCEHQWDATYGVVEGETELPEEVKEVAGLKVKQCPKCHEYIEKNGGCDHMTCRCKHQFSWTTLKDWR